MKSFILFFIVVLAKQSVQQNNVLQPRLQTRIVGGKPARPGQFPYHVGVFADGGRCGGTIISNRHILTAAHCLVNDDNGEASSTVLIIVGTNIINDVYHLNVKDQTINFIASLVSPFLGISQNINTLDYLRKHVIKLGSDSIVTHKDYNSYTITNDIGLITLPEHLTFNRFINIDNIAKLPSRSFNITGHKIITTGWGLTNDDINSHSNMLLYISYKVAAENECTRKYVNFDSKIQICINSHGHTTCLGDSGGPNVVEQGEGRPIVVGITSYGSASGCTKNKPDVLTRVSSYLDWIHDNTGIPIEN